MLADVLGLCSRLVVQWPFVRLASTDDAPPRFRRKIEAQQRMVAFGDLKRGLAVAVLLGQPVDLVVEHVREPLQEEKRQQIVLELGGVLLAADRAGRVPEHLLHGLGRRSCRGAPAAARYTAGAIGSAISSSRAGPSQRRDDLRGPTSGARLSHPPTG